MTRSANGARPIRRRQRASWRLLHRWRRPRRRRSYASSRARDPPPPPRSLSVPCSPSRQLRARARPPPIDNAASGSEQVRPPRARRRAPRAQQVMPRQVVGLATRSVAGTAFNRVQSTRALLLRCDGSATTESHARALVYRVGRVDHWARHTPRRTHRRYVETVLRPHARRSRLRRPTTILTQEFAARGKPRSRIRRGRRGPGNGWRVKSMPALLLDRSAHGLSSGRMETRTRATRAGLRDRPAQ